MHCGLPQGTKLGPVGFQIVINDAAQGSKSQYWKYVDDMTFAENCKIGSQGHLKTDLDNFKVWSDANHLHLNLSKCHALQVCFNKSQQLPGYLTIGDEPISFVDEAKVLSLWIQNDLKWDRQIKQMLTKANRKLFMLRSLKRFGFSSKELSIVFIGYVRPVLEYGAL